MTMFKRSLALALLVSIVTTGQAPAQATPLQLTALPAEPVRPLIEDSFCFVAGVDRIMNGVGVHFTRPVSVLVTGSDGYKSTRKYNPDHQPNTEKDDTEGAVLYLRPGMAFSIINTPEDSCVGRLVREGGQDGLRMDATAFNMGRKETATDFIPAQPVDAYVREHDGRDYKLYAAFPAEAARIRPLKPGFGIGIRELQRGMAELARDQGTERAQAKIPTMVVLSHHETSFIAGSNPRFLSLQTEAMVYTGGAHEFPGQGALLWDRADGQERKIETMFTDGMAAFETPWCAALDIQREAASDGRWKRGSGTKYLDMWGCPTLDKLAIVPLGQSGQPFDRIRLIAGPYLAGPYSDGSWTVTLPVTAEVIALMKPEYRNGFRVYGGAAGR